MGMPLAISINPNDLWDETKGEFITVDGCELLLEHSLLSISKWESKWHKAFLGKQPRTTEETIDYIKCMTLNKNVDDSIYYALSRDNMKKIQEYIDNPMSATVINKPQNNGGSNGDTLTSELIYYYMFTAQIPIECERWHLNRLIKLIEIFGIKNNPPKKMSRGEIISRNRALNAQRKAKYNTKG